ncbi:MAG: hypothetical protein B0D91_01175 [Oceanospirillales bacterium LUC14_002_19_P2]|nr:MAG: hypothetical protein B0D91_01175 [Oceanospirillales bacterium LUC14_002_19_P2]
MQNKNLESEQHWTPELARFSGPRYKALADAIEEAVGNGQLPPETRLPTHRSLAEQLNVTVGTVTRGYAEAERRRLVVARVGSGTFVRGKRWDRPDFSIPAETDTTLLDLSLSLSVPACREKMLADTLSRLSDNSAKLSPLLKYHPEQGLLRHREMVAHWLERFGIYADPACILMTNGGQHANSLVLRAMTRPGDTVLSDYLTYPRFIYSVRQQQLRHVGVPMDEQGMRPDALVECCRQHQPRLLYLMPALHNPTSVIMPEARRREILAIAAEFNVLVLEDDVKFSMPENRTTAMVSMAPEQVIYSGSFSKSLGGGLHMGFAVCPPDLVERIGQVLRSDCWSATPLMAEVVMSWLDSGKAWELMTWQRDEIAARQAMVADTLNCHDLQSQPFSFHCWLKLPEPWRANTFVTQLEQQGVRVLGAEMFAAGSSPAPQGIRFCISSLAERRQLQEALEIIRDTLALEPIQKPIVF